MKKVKVTADPAGNVIVPSKTNSEYGHIRVEQEQILVDDKGFARTKVLSALIPGTLKDLQAFGWAKGQEVEGKIIYKEQLTPFNTKQPERDYKIAGKTGIICCVDGKPIFRKTFYCLDEKAPNVDLLDTNGSKLGHTNTEDIRAKYAELKETGVVSDSEIGKL